MNDAQANGLTGWLRSLEQLVPTPPRHRGDRVDRAETLRLLRCPGPTLDALVEHGLPCDEDGGEQWFERADIYNVALWSGSGRSRPELSGVFVRRLSAERREEWVAELSWNVRLELRCPRKADCEGGKWALGQPVPEALGGSEASWRLPQGASLSDGALRADAAREGIGFEGSFTTRGYEREVRAPALRDAFGEITQGYRYQVLSASWKQDLDTVRRARVADCAAATAILAEACRAAGYEAETEAGFLLGMFGFGGHQWVRARDDDGDWKVLEPTLPLLSCVDSAGREAAEFARFCCGSALNRIVRCRTLGGMQLVAHRCGEEWVRPDLALRARPAARTEAREPVA